MNGFRWMVSAACISIVAAFVACSDSDSDDVTSVDDAGTTLDGGTSDDAASDGATGEEHDAGVDGNVQDANIETDASDASVDDASTDDASDGSTDADPVDASTAMVLTSDTLSDGGRFPSTHTCNDVNTSPALSWTAGPAGTKSYAIVMKDLTVPNVHWILYDVPATTLSVGASVPVAYEPGAPAPAGSKQSGVTFSRSTFGYVGPCPPRNATPDHDYVFTVYALAGSSVSGVAKDDAPEVIEAKITSQKVTIDAEASLHSKYMQP